jgi:hypothetical protein
MRRFLSVFAVAALIMSALAPSALAAHPEWAKPAGPSAGGISVVSSFTGAKSNSGRLAQSDAGLLARTDSHMVNVMVKLDVDALASYAGGVRNLRPTSPSVTGQPLKDGAAANNAYMTYLLSQAKSARDLAKNKIANISFGQNFLVAYGGFAARLPANQAKKLLKVPGVVAVQLDSVQHPLVDYSQHYIGADQVWPSLGGSVHAGQGTILADLDTGIWPEHPMLADNGIPNPGGGPYNCDFGLSGEANDAAFVCNDKMLGGYAFLDTNLAVTGPGLAGEYCPNSSDCSARDADGHGTHTSTTAAGDLVNSAVLLGVERGPLSGIAPGASVIEYRICDTDGCFESDSTAAIQQAITDGVDVINFSISGGANAYNDPVELAFLDAYAAGISVNASAGNSGPGAATADHGGPWTNTIGASTWNKSFGSTLHLTATGGSPPLFLDITGVTVTAGITSPTPVVLASAAPYSDSACASDPSSGSEFAGEIIVCVRGGNARVDKGYRVSLGGGAGMILSNQSAGVTDLESDNHFLPAIHVEYDSDAVQIFVSTHTGVMATWAGGALGPAQGDVMASFSSRGPTGDFIKPDLTAPGVQILAGNSPKHLFSPADGLGPNDELYQAIAGTSMSGPHAAGTALLIKASHPGWTPGQIKSAMMTSAVHDVVKEDGSTPADPFDDGAGAIRANRAVTPTVTFDVNAVDYYASANDPLHRVNLNLPSINAPDMQGVVTTTRTARNVSGHTVTIDLSASGAGVSVSPHVLTIGPLASASFTVKMDAGSMADGQYFGWITLNSRTAGDLNAMLPVAFNKHPSDAITFSNGCDSTTIAVNTSTPCEVSATNYVPETAHVSIRVKVLPRNKAKLTDYAPANKRRNGFLINATLESALPPPVLALFSPAGDGLFDLSGYSFLEIPGFGDETIQNLSLSYGVRFGDVVYDTLGVTSDGYIVLGGGDSADIAFVPQNMPDTARPNGVVAPYWTDFDMGSGGGFFAAQFDCYTTGDHCAYEFEWSDVPIYGTTDTRTFAVWMYTDDFLTSVSYPYDNNELVYGTAVAGDAGTPMNVGAEDALGLTAAQLGVDDTGTTAPDPDGYYVITGSSTPGGTVTVDYNMVGKHAGNGNLIATMTSDQTVGQAKIVTPFTITP